MRLRVDRTDWARSYEQEAHDERHNDGQKICARVQAVDGLDIFLRWGMAGPVVRLLGRDVPGTHQDIPRCLRAADRARDRAGADIPGEVGPPADRAVAGVGAAGTGERRVR